MIKSKPPMLKYVVGCTVVAGLCRSYFFLEFLGDAFLEDLDLFVGAVDLGFGADW